MGTVGNTIAQVLAWAVSELNASKELHENDNPRLDAELLLACTLQQSRTYLFTWSDRDLTDSELNAFKSLLAERRLGVPVAYLLGSQGFWSLDLKVNSSTLIPRPETELLVETVLAKKLPQNANILDLGTGSGAIALALAYEQPSWSITAVDQSAQALAVARENAELYGINNVLFAQSDWYSGLSKQRFDVIVSNPPYIDEEDDHLGQGDVRFEPSSALVAKDQGLADIKVITHGARTFLVDSGWLLFEHGHQQGNAAQTMLLDLGYQQVRCIQDFGARDRVTEGRYRGGSDQ